MGFTPPGGIARKLGEMPDPSTGDQYQSVGVSNISNWSNTHFEILADYKIAVSFADGTSGTADLTPRLSQGPLGDGLDPLCNKSEFAKAYLEYGALTWPGLARPHRSGARWPSGS